MKHMSFRRVTSIPLLYVTEFAKLYMGFVVLVKKMSVLINFLFAKYQSCVSP